MRSKEVLLTGRHAVVATDHVRVERLSQRDLARVRAGEGRGDLVSDAIAQPLGFLGTNAGQVVWKQPAANAPGHADGRRRRRGGPVPPSAMHSLLSICRGWTRPRYGPAPNAPRAASLTPCRVPT